MESSQEDLEKSTHHKSNHKKKKKMKKSKEPHEVEVENGTATIATETEVRVYGENTGSVDFELEQKQGSSVLEEATILENSTGDVVDNNKAVEASDEKKGKKHKKKRRSEEEANGAGFEGVEKEKEASNGIAVADDVVSGSKKRSKEEKSNGKEETQKQQLKEASVLEKDIGDARGLVDAEEEEVEEQNGMERKAKAKKSKAGDLEPEEKNAVVEGDKSTAEASDWKEEKHERKRKRGKDSARLEVGEKEMNENGEEAGVAADARSEKEKKMKKRRKKQKEKSSGNEQTPLENGHGDEEDAAKSNKKGKRVSFSNEVQVFPLGGDEEGEESGEEQVVHGKWFTQEEDAKILEAVHEYIHLMQLGENGLDMVLHCKSYPQVKGCWRQIVSCLPYRTRLAVYKRAHIILERSDQRKWESEEYDVLRRFYEQNGADWKKLADQLGKNRNHVRDAWRRIKPPNLKKGAWSQEEYQTLFDLVNLDLQLKAYEEKTSCNRLLRDNISWEAISRKLSTRSNHICCLKWYNQLASPLVKEGLWADVDDYRLVGTLQKVDAVCTEDVDWDNLLDHRSGEICQKRWNQMVRHIGGKKERSFIEQVEVLSKRYRQEMTEYRE